MRLSLTLLSICATALAAVSELPLTDSATISIQPLSASSSSSPPIPLCELSYNPSTLSAEVLDFTPPVIDETTTLVRVGIWDSVEGRWKSSTSTTSAETFRKGYKSTIVVTLAEQGEVLGVSVKGSRLDAGASREFGPKVVVRGVQRGGEPVLNRPVVLSAEGKVEVPVVEKTMLQKYWWVILGGVMLLMTAGGGEA